MKIDAKQTSLLALIAQKPDRENTTILKALKQLDGIAHAIALHVLGVETSTDPEVRRYAERLTNWVNEMRAQSETASSKVSPA